MASQWAWRSRQDGRNGKKMAEWLVPNLTTFRACHRSPSGCCKVCWAVLLIPRARHVSVQGEVDTIDRIHGAAKLTDIGSKRTAGCIGMLNADIIDLYSWAGIGTQVAILG
jgi:L,D-transpeptidase catalytic domain